MVLKGENVLSTFLQKRLSKMIRPWIIPFWFPILISSSLINLASTFKQLGLEFLSSDLYLRSVS